MMHKNGLIEADLIQLIESYSFEQFDEALNSWLQNGTTVWFIHGNFLKEEAIEIVNKARASFNMIDVEMNAL